MIRLATMKHEVSFFQRYVAAVVWMALASACQPAPTLPATVHAESTTASPDLPTVTRPSRTPTALPSPTPTPSATLTPVPTIALCSPFEGVSLTELADPNLLKNPFLAPPPGDDGGHFGVDFSYWSDADGTAMLGLPIHAVLAGQVAGMIADRPPYGNALLLETPLDQLPEALLARLPLQDYDPNAPLQTATTLSCPDYAFQHPNERLSLYLLYAHMLQTPEQQLGQALACGQQIGLVGTSGKSVNPHLHLEMRIGPSGIQFASMAHYDNSATLAEMRTYCLWRISGAFMAFDPMRLLEAP
jgi:murein DD-endopeptidase MepM/ murein hydrolase activator NlpD